MGLFDRIARIAKAQVNDLRDRPSPPSGDRALEDLSDKELEEEILRRRRDRAARRAAGLPEEAPKAAPEPARVRSPGEQQIAQYYANLELPNGAPLDQVRKAYREMMKRYHPDKHIGDPERHKAATELAQSLTRSYTALLAYLEKR